MATVRKRVTDGKTKFYAEVCIKGKRTGKTFDNKPAAQAWALAREQELGKHGGIITGRTLGDAIERYRREITPTKRGARWDDIGLGKISRDPLCHTVLTNLTTDDIQDWLDGQCKMLKPSSANRYFTMICAVLNVARLQWKWMVTTPQKDVRRPKDQPPRVRRISQQEIDRIPHHPTSLA